MKRPLLALFAIGLLSQVARADGQPVRRPGQGPRPGAYPLFLVDFFPSDQRKLFQTFNQAELVFTAKVTEVGVGGLQPSLPPIHNLALTFEDIQVLRGPSPTDPTFLYSKRQDPEPEFTRKTMVVAANRYRPNAPGCVVWLMEADENNLALVRRAVSVSPGWLLEDGKAVSPWARLGEKAWPRGTRSNALPVCSACGRPALLAGEGITLQAEPAAGAAPQLKLWWRLASASRGKRLRQRFLP
jgi:hypothetical protein